MRILAASIGTKNAIEVGTFTGYRYCTLVGCKATLSLVTMAVHI